MKVAVFSTKPYDRRFLEAANQDKTHQLHFFEVQMNEDTAILASDYPAICVFVNDNLDRPTIAKLAAGGTKLIALRCAGFNNVDLKAAKELGLTVVRVPAYSPYAVTEYTIALILTLNRKIHRAYNRVREGNFAIDGLVGFDLNCKTVGIIGTGKIGFLVAEALMKGFGCKILAYDPYPNPDLAAMGAKYVDLDELARRSDIITLHCPLTPETHYIINEKLISEMKKGVMLVNTGRGKLIDTKAVIEGLKSKKIGYIALDVYEQEANFFFEDFSNEIIADDVLQRLVTFPNAIVTSHQAFFTETALNNISETTLGNITDFETGKDCPNQIAIE
ncbi:MAG: 2-hydroxyacid dehydrogenase [Prochloraceae cyanobacterium]|nr:2-hydroxyacid dehydrogenase [Prochloraceae cyanobacterium]